MTAGASPKPAGTVAHISREKADLLRLLLEKNLRRDQQIQRLPRVPIGGHIRFPPSSAQQSLWFIDQVASGNTGYHVQIAMRLRGPLDPTAVQNALDRLLERHEILRTVFPDVNGEPMQEIVPQANWILGAIDLTHVSHADKQSQLRARAHQDASGKFDLRSGPLVRATLVRLGSDESVLLLTLHHIIADGWSKSVLVREFASLYGLPRDEVKHGLPLLPVQYADYVSWQKAWLDKDAKAAKQLEYWRVRLAGAPSQLELPTDRKRAAAPSFRGANCVVTIDAALSAKMKSFAAAHRMTLSMVLQAAWIILLSRLSRQEDVLVGVPVANRQRPEVEPLIGLFVNTLVLRTPVSATLPLIEFLRQVKQLTLEAFDHQDVPFEQVVQALQVPRSLSFNPLFQVAFVVKNTPQSELHPRGLQLTLEELAEEPTNLDLALFIEERGAEIEATATYATDLFERATIESWLECYLALLGSFVEEHATLRPLCELRILSASQRKRLDAFARSEPADYPRHRPIHAVFEGFAERTPDAIAVVDQSSQQMTYGALNAAANRLAHYLIEHGVRPGDRVPVLMPRSLSLLTAQLAILKSGAAYVPIDPESPPDRQAFMIEDCGGRLLIGKGDKARAFPHLRLACLDEIEQRDLPRYPATDPRVPMDASAMAYVMYTSGSTGVPKGVAVTHRGVTRLVINTNYWKVGPTDCVAHCSNPIFDASTLEIWGAWLNGARLLIVSPHDALDAQRLSQLITTGGVTILFLTAALLSQHSETLGSALGNVRYLITGGDIADVRALRRVLNSDGRPGHLVNGYGPTENSVITSTYRVDRIGESETSIPIGRPISNTQVYILDDRLEPVPIGAVGEIYTAGDGVALSYLNRPELTAERFVASPFSASGAQRLYRTGDLGRWRADGNIEFLGRADQQVKLRGLRVELGEIEAHVLKHSLVKEAAVWVHVDDQAEKRLVAHIVPQLADPSDDEERQTYFDDVLVPQLREHLLEHLPHYMVPSAWALCERLPLTPTGKIDRRKLTAPARWTVTSGEHVAPTTELEQTLADIWSDVLKIDRVGITENFFELGGHSLMGVKLLARIKDRVNAQLPAATVFHYPTIQQMAEFIRCQPAANTPTVSSLEGEAEQDLTARHDIAPLSHTQRARWNSYQNGERRPMRTVTMATRLSGPLDVEALQRALTQVVARHDALRTNIAIMDGEPVQRIAPAAEYSLGMDDISALSSELQATRIDDAAADVMFGPIDPGKDRLLETRLLRLSASEHVLIVGLEHIVADGYSLSIVLKELLQRYEEIVNGTPSSLPAVTLQFSQYTRDQARGHRSWKLQHGRYWDERLLRCGRSRFPGNGTHGPLTQGAATVALSLSSSQRRDLVKWCQQHRTTPALAALTAYIGVVLRWCKSDRATVQYLSDCRNSPSLEHAIGFFASPLYLCIEAGPQDRFCDLLSRVMDDYGSAVDHVDHGFFESQVPRPDFTRCTSFNWVPQLASTSSPSPIAASVEPLAHTTLGELQLDQDPGILLYDMQDEVNGVVHFPRERFSMASMERFAESFVRCLDLLQREPRIRLNEITISPTGS